jgi:hypothetical protein
MRLFDDAHSYKTADNAIKQLDKALAPTGLTLHDVRYTVVVTSKGRFLPVIFLRGVDLHLARHFADNHVAVSSF